MFKSGALAACAAGAGVCCAIGVDGAATTTAGGAAASPIFKSGSLAACAAGARARLRDWRRRRGRRRGDGRGLTRRGGLADRQIRKLGRLNNRRRRLSLDWRRGRRNRLDALHRLIGGRELRRHDGFADFQIQSLGPLRGGRGFADLQIQTLGSLHGGRGVGNGGLRRLIGGRDLRRHGGFADLQIQTLDPLRRVVLSDRRQRLGGGLRRLRDGRRGRHGRFAGPQLRPPVRPRGLRRRGLRLRRVLGRGGILAGFDHGRGRRFARDTRRGRGLRRYRAGSRTQGRHLHDDVIEPLPCRSRQHGDVRLVIYAMTFARHADRRS